MSKSSNPGYWIGKMVGRKTGYPIGTVAFSGPDDRFASKAAVGIVASESTKEPASGALLFNR